MNIFSRQLFLGIWASLFIFSIATGIHFVLFPLPEWSTLWENEIYDIPYILFVFTVSVSVGILLGILSGVYWRKQIKTIDNALLQIEQGRKVEEEDLVCLKGMESISIRISHIQKQVAEQAKLSQKLANEKAIDQEKLVQDLISQERHRLARELHDSVSQQLFAASMLMSAITESFAPDKEQEVKQFRLVEEMIHQSQLEMRALLLHLRPVPLKGKSLQEGMKELLVELKQKVPLTITWKIDEMELDKGIEDHLFRVLQESVSNTLRHSKAQNLNVLLIERDQLVILRVEDDGVGFKMGEQKAGSYGLQNMHERALEIGGMMKIISVPQKGTRLEVKVPMVNKEGDGID